MPTPEPTSTYLELRESTAEGDQAAGLSHTPGGMFLLHVQEVAAYGEPVGGVTIVHDAGDHGGRYLDAAGTLAAAGWAVALPDLRGHGKSEGERGHSSGLGEVVRDLDEVQQHLAYRLPIAPKVLVGQGLGGLYALTYAIENPGSVAALVLLSPRLAPSFELPAAAGGLMKMFKKTAPTDVGAVGLDPSQLTTDPAQQAAWTSDELTHDLITRRAAEQAAEAGRTYPARIADVGAPVLVLHGASDAVADPALSTALTRDGVEVRLKPGRTHDLLHEPDGAAVADEIRDWIVETAG
jgi:alpha-beta hydrolase superfamily lysophospholipase